MEDSAGHGFNGHSDEKSTEMGMKLKFGAFALMAALQTPPCMAAAVSLETTGWPTAGACNACVTFQFGILSMRLPTDMIGRIFLAGSEAAAVHLLPPGSSDSRNSAVFLSAPRTAYIGKYQTFGLPGANTMSGEAFFDLLGRPAPTDNALQKIRRIESIEAAQHYTKASNGRLHAYWIQTSPEKSQYLHIVVDGSETIYTVAGAITPQLYNALLSGLSVQPEP